MKRAAAAVLAALASGCAGHQQSALDAAGTQAAHIQNLFWFFSAVLAIIFLLVQLTALRALLRRHHGIQQEPLEHTHEPSPQTESRLTRNVAAVTIVTVLILWVLLITSLSTGKAIAEIDRRGALNIELTAVQWWWQARYLDADPSRIFVTANELHVPVGRTVSIRETSRDVIHSFWVPNLHGKRDLIPSKINNVAFRADQPGRWRGQCAEFCGLQHAHMALWVVAETEADFNHWYDRQLQPAEEPADPVRLRGRQVFLNSACVFCHRIGGTPANGLVAPDLTHVGGRFTIAAGTLPNNIGNLTGWIADPQSVKPGNHMAVVPIAPPDLQPLAEYLEGLK